MPVERSPVKGQLNITQFCERRQDNKRKGEPLEKDTVAKNQRVDKINSEKAPASSPGKSNMGSDAALQKILEKMTALQSSVDETKASVDETKITVIETKAAVAKLEALQTEVKTLKSQVKVLEEDSSSHSHAIRQLQRENQFLQKKLRESNLILRNFPEVPQENTTSLKAAIIAKLESAREEPVTSIDLTHRLGRPVQGKNRLVRIRLGRLDEKWELMKIGRVVGLKLEQDLTPEGSRIKKIIGDVVGHARRIGKSAKHCGHFALVGNKKIFHEDAQSFINSNPEETRNEEMDFTSQSSHPPE